MWFALGYIAPVSEIRGNNHCGEGFLRIDSGLPA